MFVGLSYVTEGTSMARSLRPIDVFPLTTRTLSVLRVVDVTPGMRRVTLGGPALAAHTAENGYHVAAFRSDGVDDEFKILLKHPDAEVAVGPTQADGLLVWPRHDEHLVMRTYSVRRWNPETGEIDIDFVLHGVGAASTWARRTQPGDLMQIAGPKASSGHPVSADWTLIAGDETALPAIGRWLEEWPEGARGQVFIEVAEQSHRQQLPTPPGVEVTWLSRDGAEPGTTTLLYDAITGAEWWPGTAFAWVAGETHTLTPIRRWLRNERGLGKEQVEVTGYWRRHEVVASANDSAVPDEAARESAQEKFLHLSEIMPAVTIRIAATIGLAGAFNSAPRTVAELAAATETDPVGLGKMLRYLESIELTELHDDGRYSLTQAGKELENEFIGEILSLDGPEGHRELHGLLALSAAIRTGKGDHAAWFGAGFEESVQSDPTAILKRVEHEAEGAVYVTGSVAASPLFEGLTSLRVAGRAAGAFAERMVAVHPELRVSVLAAPSELAAMSTVHPDHERIVFEPGSMLEARPEPTDGYLICARVETLSDADAVFMLRQAAASLTEGGRIIIFGSVLDPDQAHDHDFEEDLLLFSLSGGSARFHEEYLRLFSKAGLELSAQDTVGWGRTIYALTARA